MLSELVDSFFRIVYGEMIDLASLLAATAAALAAVGALVLGIRRALHEWRERNSAHVVLDRVRPMNCDLVVRNVGDSVARNVKVHVESGSIGEKRTGGMLLTVMERIAPGAPVVFSEIEKIGKGTTIEISWEDDAGGGRSGPHPIRQCESASYKMRDMDLPDLSGPDPFGL